LKKLEKLDISFNNIQQIPSTIGKCPQLSDLSLQNNALTKLPGSIFNLNFLRQLNLSNNRLPSIPGHIGQLSWLAQLDLSHNRLKRLPSALGDCTQLQTLQLQNNRLTSLPASLGKLKKLVTLHLDHNQLKRLPGLPLSLEELSVADNKLNRFPSSLPQLHLLKKLNLSDNPLKKLARTVNHLKSLVHFDFSKCPEDFEIPSFLHLPPITSIACDQLNADQAMLLLDILKVNEEIQMSWGQKKELFSFSEERKKTPISTLLQLLNLAGPNLSYVIRKKLISKAPDLPKGSRISLIGRSNPVLESLTNKWEHRGITFGGQLREPTHLLFGEPPYPRLSEKELQHLPWLNAHQLLDLFHKKDNAPLSDDQKQTMERLLRSSHPAQNRMGIQLIYGIGLDESLWNVILDIFKEKPAGILSDELLVLLKTYADEEQRKELDLNLFP
jgi:hypothetical protein